MRTVNLGKICVFFFYIINLSYFIRKFKNYKQMEVKNYESPCVNVIYVEVEAGFALSSPGQNQTEDLGDNGSIDLF